MFIGECLKLVSVPLTHASRLAAERLAEVVARLVEVFAQSVGKVLPEATARQPAARRVHLEGVEQEGEVVGLERAAAARQRGTRKGGTVPRTWERERVKETVNQIGRYSLQYHPI